MTMKKYIYIVMMAFLLLGFTSCLNDEPVFKDNGDYGIVELNLAYRTTATPYAIRNVARGSADVIDVNAEINYTGVNGTSEDVTVTLGIENSAVAEYATYMSQSIVVLPEGSYSLPASNTVVIPKGQKTATYTIKVNASALDASVATYGIGIKILGASAGRVSGNYSTGVYRLTR
jgi:hypothetical protein